MTNTYRGEVTLHFNGKDHTITYDWNALSKLKSAYSETELDKVMSGDNLDAVADVLCIGLERHHPGLYTVKDLMGFSMPLVTAVAAIDETLTCAYFGPDGPPVVKKGTQEQTPAKQKKTKKTKSTK